MPGSAASENSVTDGSFVRRIPVSVRVSIISVLVLCLLWLAALLVGVTETRNVVADALGERAHAVANSVALGVGPALAARDLALAQTTIDSLFDATNHRRIVLFDGAGLELVASRSNDSASRAPLWFARVVGLQDISARAPVASGVGNHAVLVELQRGSEAAALWRYATVITWTFVVGTMLLLGYIVSVFRSILAPLPQLEQQLTGFRRGDFDQQSPSTVTAEHYAAFGAANALSEHMSEQADDWSESINLLEARIEVDALTGLANRGGLERALSRSDGPGAFALVRIENLDTVERQLGALGVNRVVAQYAGHLKGHGFGDDESRLGRLDGGTFVCLRHASGTRVASDFAKRLSERVADCPLTGAHPVVIGVVSFSKRQQFDDLLAAAEHTLDAARRDPIRMWAVRTMPDKFEAGELSPRARFLQALDTRELELRFRPSRNAENGVFVNTAIATLTVDGIALSGRRLSDVADQMSCRERLDTAVVSWVLAESAFSDDRLATIMGDWIFGEGAWERLMRTLDPDEDEDWSPIVFEVDESDVVRHGTRAVRAVIKELSDRDGAIAVVNAGLTSSALGYLKTLDLAYVKVASVIGRCLDNNSEVRFATEGLIMLAEKAEVPIILSGIDTRSARSMTSTTGLVPEAWEGDYTGLPRLAEIHRGGENAAAKFASRR